MSSYAHSSHLAWAAPFSCVVPQWSVNPFS